MVRERTTVYDGVIAEPIAINGKRTGEVLTGDAGKGSSLTEAIVAAEIDEVARTRGALER
jgi:hypothetical protein